MSNIYSVRIPSRNVNSVVELKSLVYDAKQQGKELTIPPAKEIRISHGDWKTKEKPGTGKSSSRDDHVKAAFDQAKELWNKDLFKRECENFTAVYTAVVGANNKITANSLALLIWVAECVDKLSGTTGLAKARCLELLAPSLGDTAKLKTLPSPNWLAEHIDTLAQESRLDKSQCLELLAHVIRDPALFNELETQTPRLRIAADAWKAGKVGSAADAWRVALGELSVSTFPSVDAKQTPAAEHKQHGQQTVTSTNQRTVKVQSRTHHTRDSGYGDAGSSMSRSDAATVHPQSKTSPSRDPKQHDPKAQVSSASSFVGVHTPAVLQRAPTVHAGLVAPTPGKIADRSDTKSVPAAQATLVDELVAGKLRVTELPGKLASPDKAAFRDAVVARGHALGALSLSWNRTVQEQLQATAWRRLGEAYGTRHGQQQDGRAEIFTREDILQLPLGHRASMVLALAEHYALLPESQPDEKARIYRCYVRLSNLFSAEDLATPSWTAGQEMFAKSIGEHVKGGAQWSSLNPAQRHEHLNTYCRLHAEVLGYQPELRFESSMSPNVADVFVENNRSVISINTNLTRGWNDYLVATHSVNRALAMVYQRETALGTSARSGTEGDVARVLRADFLAPFDKDEVQKRGMAPTKGKLPLSPAAKQRNAHADKLKVDIQKATGIQGVSSPTERRLNIGVTSPTSSKSE